MSIEAHNQPFFSFLVFSFAVIHTGTFQKKPSDHTHRRMNKSDEPYIHWGGNFSATGVHNLYTHSPLGVQRRSL
jgi:hypothetical protein